MRATMILADHAQVADGKLFISGGGWAICGPGPAPCSVAVLFHVPWQETEQKISFTLRLDDEDGRPVQQPGDQGMVPVQVNGHFQAHRGPSMAPGTEVNVPMSFNIVLQLDPGERFTWVLEVDGYTDDSWRLSFATREAAPAPS